MSIFSLALALAIAPTTQPHQQPTPVLVELFTSEGCSSCPPADRLLARMQGAAVPGAVVIPIGEHVDYWDGARWRDPFSAHLFSERQEAYARAFRIDGPYTPQMVVDGQAQFVGSDEEAAAHAVAAAARVPKTAVEVTAAPAGADALSVHVTVAAAPTAEDVYLVVTENNLGSHVLGGENRGRRLAHTAVARRFAQIGHQSPGASLDTRTQIAIAPDWKRSDLSIVAFVQDRSSGRIHGSAIISAPR